MFLYRPAPMPVEWLEKTPIRIPREMSPRRPGPFKADPYQVEPLNCWHPESGVSDVIFSAGAQITKTTNALLGLAYRMRWRPLPALWVMPSEDAARKQISGDKLVPLIDANPELRALKPSDPRLFAALEMHLDGMQLSLAGANSPTALGGRTKGLIVIDEAAKIAHEKRKDANESHPIKLASERAKDLKGLSFRWVCSTPNLETNYFWLEWERGDQRLYYVPCPNCGGEISLDWVMDEGTGYRSIVWPESCRNAAGDWVESKVKELARYQCPHCEYQIGNEEKPAMSQAGAWKATIEGEGEAFRSYLLTSFYSSQSTWGDCAVEFLRGQDLFGLQNFSNSWRARPFSEIKINVKREAVEKCRADWYRLGQVRGDVDFLVVTSDPGQKKDHWEISAVMKNGDVAVVMRGTALGFGELAKLPREIDGKPVISGLIDCRYNTEEVLSFCWDSKGFWWPTMGQEASMGTWNKRKVQSHPGLFVYNYSDYNLKFELYGRMIAGEVLPLELATELEHGTRRFWLPADADKELVAHHSGQQLTEDKGNRESRKWKRLPNDHWGDCSKLAVLARMIVETRRREEAQRPPDVPVGVDPGPVSGQRARVG
jgi:hypothetical protein